MRSTNAWARLIQYFTQYPESKPSEAVRVLKIPHTKKFLNLARQAKFNVRRRALVAQDGRPQPVPSFVQGSEVQGLLADRVHVHRVEFSCVLNPDVRDKLLAVLPVPELPPVGPRNRMRTFRCDSFSFQLHWKSGRLTFFPYPPRDRAFEDFFSWLVPQIGKDEAYAVVSDFEKQGPEKLHFAVDGSLFEKDLVKKASGLTIVADGGKPIGQLFKFKIDKTPFKDTFEVEVDTSGVSRSYLNMAAELKGGMSAVQRESQLLAEVQVLRKAVADLQQKKSVWKKFWNWLRRTS